MRIAVITCPRGDGVSYLQQTLDDLLFQDPSVSPRDVKVFSDSVVPPDVPAGVRVEYSSQSRLDLIERDQLKGMVNQIRAMKWAADGGEYGCVLEDDVLFAGDWHSRAVRLARGLDIATQGHSWALTLQHWFGDLARAFDMPGSPEERFSRPSSPPRIHVASGADFRNMDDYDKTACPSAVRSRGSDRVLRWNCEVVLWGSQGYMLHYVTMRKIAELLERKLRLPASERRYWRLDEGIMRAQTRENLFVLYGADPCLLKHVGEVSRDWPGEKLGWRTAKLFDQASRRTH
jgi:hypothetical protein